jgi:hypothetical protein
VNVPEIRTDSAVAGGNTLFFNIGVEGVKENADIRMANLPGKRRSLRLCFESVAFRNYVIDRGEPSRGAIHEPA